MKNLIFAAAVLLSTSSAYAADPVVPEMSAGAGVTAIALLLGAAAILRERRKK